MTLRQKATPPNAQRAYPYGELVETNRRRSRGEAEYELLDTGVFGDDRYFDVFVEYAKQTPEDVLIKVTVHNRGPQAAELHVLPTLWFRNTWSWPRGTEKPALRQVEGVGGASVAEAATAELGKRFLYCQGQPPLLFTENQTNNQRIFGTPNESPYVKDAIDSYVVHGQGGAVNPDRTGTKVAALYRIAVPAGEAETISLRLTPDAPGTAGAPFGRAFEDTLAARIAEADEFYQSVTPPKATADEARVMRQAMAGMLWSKQYYYFDADLWLEGHGIDPFSPTHRKIRNVDWYHMVNDHIISMPDKWEYPWYAAWDLAFHTIAISAVDVDFAKEQLDLMLQEIYLHPSGQIPAYEWNFSDVNPPVHAWAALFLYRTEQAMHGKGDLNFIKRIFNKLLLNFTWWVNRKDRQGKNIFEGGFLGLDNIGVFDRSAPLPTGGFLEQADGTAWMSLFCQTMMELSIELAADDPSYGDMVGKFLEHFLWIAAAINQEGAEGMWDEEDGFYYDLLRMPDGRATRLKVRSMVGLLPLCAAVVIEPWQRERVPRVTAQYLERVRRMPELLNRVHATGPGHMGVNNRGIMALVNEQRLRRILARMLDEREFLSPYGIRALSRYHQEHPYVLAVNGSQYRVDYLPAESDTGMFGGNSNWRGPIWMPVNVLLIRALLQYYLYYGDSFQIECPTGSGVMMNLFEVASELARRLTAMFLRDAAGRRPVYGNDQTFQNDPHWRDYILFYEYFHGDTGLGLGASHQTGWTGLVGKLIELFGFMDQRLVLELGKAGGFRRETVPVAQRKAG